MKYTKWSLLVCGLVVLLVVPCAFAGQNADAKYNVDFDFVVAGNGQDIILNDLLEGDAAIGADTQFAFAVYATGLQNLKSFDLRVKFDDTLLEWDAANSVDNIPGIMLLNGQAVTPAAEANIIVSTVPTIAMLVPDKTDEVTVSRTMSGTIDEDTCPDGEGLLYFFVFKTKADFPADRSFRITVSALQCVDVAGDTDFLNHSFYGYVNRHGVGVETSTWGAVKALFK